MKNKTNSKSLKLGIILIAICCWILPMVLVLYLVAVDTGNNANKQFAEDVDSMISEISRALSMDISNLVEDSRQVSYDGIIREAYEQYKEDTDSERLYNTVMKYLNNSFKYDDDIHAALLYYTDLPRIYYTVNAAIPSSQSKFSYYQEYVHEETVRISKELDTGIDFYNSGDYLYMIRNIVDSDFRPIAVIVFRLNDRNLFGLLSEMSWCNGGIVYLNDVAYYLDDSIIKYADKPDKQSIPVGSHTTRQYNDIFLVDGYAKTDGVDILYSIEFDRKIIGNTLSNYGSIINWVMLAFIPIFIFCMRYVMRNIFRPIRNLNEAAKRIEKGELGTKVSAKSPNNEFRYLSEAFDSMSLRLKEQFDQIYSEELALRDAKILSLQMQINPHFLNNTLEIINWEARLAKNTKVSNMIESLSTILDAAMARDRAPLIKLSQELSYLNAYLYIITERYGKRLEIEKIIDNNLLDEQIPRLIMQPLIENAVEYGIPSAARGKITIEIKKQNNIMYLTVENNSSLSDESREKIKRILSPSYSPKNDASGSLGIYNVNMRLKMIYGEESGLEITGTNGKTISIIKIVNKQNGICKEI